MAPSRPSRVGRRHQAISRIITYTSYGLMVVAAITIFLTMLSAGEQLGAVPATAAVPRQLVGPEGNSAMLQVLLALGVVVLTAQVMGSLFKYVWQPRVVGEIIGGLLLGPSVLGHVAPHLSSQLLPVSVLSYLGLHAQFGVILYMFIVGLDFDTRMLRASGHAAVAISHAGIIAPSLAGAALALYLYPRVSSSVPFTPFALFIAVSLSVTAFPVLARILTDRRISHTRMGSVALTCAAVDDVTAWCLLALVVAVTRARATDAIRTIALAATFTAVTLLVVRPLVAWLVSRVERSAGMAQSALAVVLLSALGMATITEYIGIHSIFGAFLFGVVIPAGSRLAIDIRERLEGFVRVLFLPAYFAFTGMRTEITSISAASWLLCALIIIIACVGKFGGTLLASRLTGLGWRDAAALGVLMNTRGLVELVVLNIGLDLHVISVELFTMLVIMAIVTTVLTTPILDLVMNGRPSVDFERGETVMA